MKNKEKVKIALIGSLTAIMTLIFVCCKDDDKDTPVVDNTPQVQREFTITVGEKTVTVKDMRTGASDTNLQDLGILTKLTNGFGLAQSHDNFNEVMGRTGFVINIEDTTAYEYYKAYDSKKLGLNFGYVNTTEVLPVSVFNMALAAMKDGATYPSQT